MLPEQNGELEPASMAEEEAFPTCTLVGCACEERGCGELTIQFGFDTAHHIPLNAPDAPKPVPPTLPDTLP